MGDPRTDVLLSVLGSAITAERLGIADPAINVLVAREQVKESTERLLMQQITIAMETIGEMKQLMLQMAEDKKRAEEALTAALEARRAAQEAQPIDARTQALMVKALSEEAFQRVREKAHRFRDSLKTAKKGVVFNTGEFTIELTVQGVTAYVKPGQNILPEPFVEAWNCHIEDEAFGRSREILVRGGRVSFGNLENWIFSGRQEPDPLVLTVVGPGTERRDLPQELET